MTGGTVGVLACPVCSSRLSPVPDGARCERGHQFDMARQGYLNLLPSGTRSAAGDSAEMVAARARFLAGGHFDGIAEAVARAARQACANAAGEPSSPPVVVEIGAGTAFYLARVLDALPEAIGVALDSSRYAARRAARAHGRAIAVVADAWQALPLPDSSVDMVLDIFAPRNAAEIARVLRPVGMLLVVTPTDAHLRELVGPLGMISVDGSKTERLASALGPLFAEEACERIEAQLSLGASDVADLVAMGPSARHVTSASLAERIAALPQPVTATLSVELRTFRPRVERSAPGRDAPDSDASPAD